VRPRPAATRRRAAALALLAAIAAGCGGEARRELPERPGILLVIGDDVGFDDYGFMGSSLARTPNLDALAAQGTVFTHAFTTASVCRPSLQSLLTGLHPYAVEARLARLRRERRAPVSVGEAFETLPERLSQAGYRTFQGGKFWEGAWREAGFTHGISEFPGWGANLPPVLQLAGGPSLALGRETLAPLFEFLEAAGSAPFFVWYAPMLPHLPFDAPPRFDDLYRDAPLSAHARGYYANLARFDAGLGEILAFLERTGLRRRTAIVYAADNGWEATDSPPADLESYGLGGGGAKLSIHERGFRTPLIVSWPGVLPEGRRDDRLVSLVDVFATLLELAGQAPPAQTAGRSLVPLLTGRGGFERPHVIGGGQRLRAEGAARAGPRQHDWALRTREWRYVFSGAEGRESLYRIEDDPPEARDLAADHPEVLRELRAALLGEIEAMDRAEGPPPRR
jgi:uncharacterized sulfatase